ncbi:uncharacterized protein LOC116176457 isoform X2 [Photinus pyralis]|uniref:uncharacterized protein LOC116176382 isoform X2 n=1 Tax=Photinus pyralis TaxID=7054 RepID=UPI0012673A7E|nr:uncharacterized protein LOC116176382 isoform X2 [Photinus pyralis]XP_031350901.1 uncharacterized protein LOC116176457 isoform X2 [Photinus pyralis]
MTGCCVPNCKNRSEQGFRLFRIPRNKSNDEKTNLWIKFVNRGELSLSACICEVHFEEHHFESARADNRKLLRWNAVPTIGACENLSPKIEIIDHCTTNDVDSFVKLEDDVGEAPTETEDSVNNVQLGQLKTKLKNAHHKISRLENKIKEMEERYSCIFSEDQLKFVKYGNHRGEEWSDRTINKGLKLYMTCGAKGYEEIRRQGLPYPSIRTLQHRMHAMKYEILEDDDYKVTLKADGIPDNDI